MKRGDLNDAFIDGRTQRRIDNRARIFDAAMGLLATRNYADVSIEEICDAAQVGRATFFRAFENKAELIREFNRRLAVRIQERLEEEAPDGISGAIRLVGSEVAQVWTHTPPGTAALAMDFVETEGSRSVHAAHPELLEIVIGLIERASERGELTTALPASLVGSLALLQITAAAAYWLAHPNKDLHRLIDEAIDSWLHGALIRPKKGAATTKAAIAARKRSAP